MVIYSDNLTWVLKQFFKLGKEVIISGNNNGASTRKWKRKRTCTNFHPHNYPSPPSGATVPTFSASILFTEGTLSIVLRLILNMCTRCQFFSSTQNHHSSKSFPSLIITAVLSLLNHASKCINTALFLNKFPLF